MSEATEVSDDELDKMLAAMGAGNEVGYGEAGLDDDAIDLALQNSGVNTTINRPPSLLSKTKHIAKGLPATLLAVADLPNTITSIANPVVRKPFEAGADALGFDFPETNLIPSPLFGVIPKFSEMLPEGFVDAVAGEEFEREEAPIADTLRTGVEWGAGGIPNAIRKITTRPDLFMAGGAMAGQALQDAFTGEAGVTGEVGGGVAGLLAALKKGRIDQIPRAVEDAYKFTRKNLDDPALALQKIKAAILRGEKGTLADLSQDQGAFNVEAGAAHNSKQSTTGRFLV